MTDDLQHLNSIIEYIFRFGERGLLQWCDENSQLVTEDLAQALHHQGLLVSKENDFKTSKRLFFQSSVIWRKLGHSYNELFEQIFYQDCLFQLTSDRFYYKTLAKKVRTLLKQSRSSENLDLAFCFAALEAECWWFAGKETNRNEVDTCLQVLNRMPRLTEVKAVRLRSWFERFISLSATVCDIFFRLAGDEEKAALFTSKIKNLSEKIKIHTADGFECRTIPTDTGPIILALARLLERFGNDDFAHFLLAQEARRCHDLNETGGVMQFLGLRYAMAANSANLATERKASIKEDFVESLEAFRCLYRSRAGRLYNAGVMEQSLGGTLREFIERSANCKETFSLVESLKAQSLLERLNDLYVPPNQQNVSKIYDLEKKLLYAKANTTTEALLVSKNDIALWCSDSDNDIRQLEQLYKQSDSGFVNIARTITIDELRGCLQEGELIIEFIVPHDLMFPSSSVSLLVIDRHRSILINLEKEVRDIQKAWKGMIGFAELEGEQGIEVSPVNNLIFRTRSAIISGEEQQSNDYLEKLGELILNPLELAGFVPENYQCWHFIPSRAFHCVPFAALKDGSGRFLIERIAVAVAPSATVWVSLAKKQVGKPIRSIAYGNPSLKNSTLPSLKEAEKEVNKISGIFSAVEWEVKTGLDATKEHFKNNAPGNTIIHIASHGLFSKENAIDSHGILLSPGSGHEGLLRADEIYNLNLENTHLFILSICNGSLYRFGPGDEPFGIIPAIITAGASNIVGTLWPLEDTVGRQMMVDFYRALRKNSPAEALRKAACFLIEAGASVFHWAGFAICGCGRDWKR